MPIRRLISSLSATIGIGARPAPTTRVTLFAICVVIFLTSLGIRLLYWQDNYAELSREKRNSGLQAVSFFYYDQAQRILDDGGILFPRNPVDIGDATVLTHPPGYSILMAAVFKSFSEPDSDRGLAQANAGLRVIQIIGDATSAVVIFLIAAELFPIGVGIVAAMLCCFSPHFGYYSLMLAPDSLSVLPILLAVYFLIRAMKRPRLITVITTGALVGLSCWLRSNALLLAPFLACVVPLLFERGKRLRYSFAIAGAAFVVIAPIIARNWIVFHQFVPLSVMAGLNLIEGIGDYDNEDRFGMPSSDTESAFKDAEWYGRPDYANSLWKPDGFERDRARFRRGLAVVRSNPGWFVGVVIRRMGFMLRYNDSRQGDFPHLTTAPSLSPEPNYGHNLAPAQTAPVWSRPARELMASGSAESGLAQVGLSDDNQAIEISSEESRRGEMFSSEAIDVRNNTDYLLVLSVTAEQGDADVRVGTADPRIGLALVSVSSAGKKPKRKKGEQSGASVEPAPEPRMRALLVPFASGDNTQVRLSLIKPNEQRAALNVGHAELFEMGPTAYPWTRLPRAVVRAVQRNVFNTDIMRVLIITGIGLLALARRGRVLAILLIVPAYYLVAQSPLHTEYRYVLAIHYFLFVTAAATIYYATLVITRAVRAALRGGPSFKA